MNPEVIVDGDGHSLFNDEDKEAILHKNTRRFYRGGEG